MSLQNLQAEFAELLHSEDGHVEHVHPMQNIMIYRNNINNNLLQVLTDTYPLIAKLLGEDFFRLTSKKYLALYPSCSGNLHDYGEYFSDFLAEYQPLKDLIYLVEVAQFEWICHRISFSATHAALDIETLQSLTEDQYSQLHFALHPASCVKKFHYPITRIIELCHDEIDGTIDIHEGGVRLLIIRRELTISFLPLSIAEFTFLNALQDNKNLSEALELTLQVDSEFQLEEKLQQWVLDKTIVGF